jgi:hypothetical protein
LIDATHPSGGYKLLQLDFIGFVQDLPDGLLEPMPILMLARPLRSQI